VHDLGKIVKEAVSKQGMLGCKFLVMDMYLLQLADDIFIGQFNTVGMNNHNHVERCKK